MQVGNHSLKQIQISQVISPLQYLFQVPNTALSYVFINLVADQHFDPASQLLLLSII
jgi:ubiquinone biosynthesis protein Coq4